MLAVISGALQLVFLILKNKFDTDAEERKRKEALHAEWQDAVKSGNVDRINDLLNKLRS